MSDAKQREWTVPEYLPANGVVLSEEGGLLPVDREEAIQTFVEAESVLHRMRGGLMIGAVVVEAAKGQFVTTGYRFRHVSYMPAARLPAEAVEDDAPPELEELSEVEPEPVEA